MSSPVSDILETMLGKIEMMAQAKTILGEPVKLGERMVIPVVKISVGFGAGGGEGSEKDKNTGTGGGGGGGFSVQPVGFIVMEGEKTAFLPVKQKSVGSLVEMIPTLIEKMKGGKKKKEEETEAKSE
ncbi:sporulation protein [bacterium]|nr:MAG: sporulation protein [bacterium]